MGCRDHAAHRRRPEGPEVPVHELIALALPGGPEFVDALRRAWDDGDAVLPIDRRLPEAAVRRLLDTYETLWRDRIERMEQILAEGSASDSKERDPR